MDSKKKIPVSLNTDEDGYISQECPNCKKRFKVNPNAGSEQPISYCPYCGHNGKNCWWTQEQVKYMMGEVNKTVVEPELDKMAKEINRKSRPGNFIDITMKVKKTHKTPIPKESNKPMPMITFDCCGETIKHDGSISEIHCIICGKEREYALD